MWAGPSTPHDLHTWEGAYFCGVSHAPSQVDGVPSFPKFLRTLYVRYYIRFDLQPTKFGMAKHVGRAFSSGPNGVGPQRP